MKSHNKFSKQLNLLIQFCAISMMLLLVTNPVGTAEGSLNTNNNIKLDQISIPQLMVKSLKIDTTTPTQGSSIKVTLQIFNNDTVGYNSSFTSFHITISNSSGDGPFRRSHTFYMVNQTFSISANSTKTFNENFLTSEGSYQLSSFVTFKGQLIPNSVYSTRLSVRGPPIGNLNELIFVAVGMLIFPVIIMILPSVIDVFRRKNHFNNNNKE